MLFEHYLSVPAEYVPHDFLHPSPIPWAEYLLNPRRLRGSDFLMRWAQGRWSEERFCSAVRQTGRYVALPYGPSGTAPQDDIVELERYFDRLERAGLGATNGRTSSSSGRMTKQRFPVSSRPLAVLKSYRSSQKTILSSPSS